MNWQLFLQNKKHAYYMSHLGLEKKQRNIYITAVLPILFFFAFFPFLLFSPPFKEMPSLLFPPDIYT